MNTNLKIFKIMKKTFLFVLVALCSMSIWAQSWEPVHMFVAPEALWSDWSHDYTLKVSLKRWNGDDADAGNWDQYTFAKSDAVYDNKAVYFGDVWICWGGFAQMTFDAYNGDSKVLDSYTFWPPETNDGHWIVKADFENKLFYGWNTDYMTDFPFISSTAGNRIWFDNSKTQWEQVYVRIGRDALTGAGNYAATWPMTQLEGTNLWYVDSEAWENALVWVITNYNGNNGEYSVYDIPAGAERLYYCNYSITERVLPLVDGNEPAGTLPCNPSGKSALLSVPAPPGPGSPGTQAQNHSARPGPPFHSAGCRPGSFRCPPGSGGNTGSSLFRAGLRALRKYRKPLS